MKTEALSIFDHRVFTLEEVWQHFRDEPLSSLKVQLSRLHKRGILTRLKKNCYVLTRSHPDPLLMGQSMVKPSYYSLEYILSREGIIPEGATSYTLMTSRKKQSYTTPFGTFDYSHMKPELFFGLEKRPDGTLFASKEKALLDYCFVHSARLKANFICFQEERFDQLEELNWEFMRNSAPQYGRKKLIGLVKKLERYAHSDSYQDHR